MYCPSCGATIKKSDQQYCQECGTTLPDPRKAKVPAIPGQGSPASFSGGSGSRNLVSAPPAMLFGIVPDTLKNRLLLYAGGGVVGLLVLWYVLDTIVHALLALVPVFIVVVLLYVGFMVWRSRSR